MHDAAPLSRRDVLKHAGLLGALALGIGTGGCEACRRQIENRPTRRNIASLAANDPIIEAYKAAVSAMKALPASDRRNWSQQADIHFNHCPHGNWWFLPWHRVYLLYFERICRTLSGYDGFALPYWNWSTQRKIPAVFWSDPLLANRFANQNSETNLAAVGPSVLDTILDQPNFLVFASAEAVNQRDNTGYGILEGGPHNNIHGFVGGTMGGYRSPLDPVFWLHHNMIECLWVNWNVVRGHPNTNDSRWTGHQFTEFVDENGAPVNASVAVSLLYPLFSYQFESCAPAERALTLDRQALERFLREGAPVRLDVIRRFELAQAIETDALRPATVTLRIERSALTDLRDGGTGNSVVLTLGEVAVPDEEDYFVRVFLGLPDASAATSIEDPHYAGSFSFFHDSEAMAGMQHPRPGFLVDVTETIRRLTRNGALQSDELPVTLVPVPFDSRQPKQPRLALQRLELGVVRMTPPQR